MVNHCYGNTCHLIPGLKHVTVLSCFGDKGQISWLDFHLLHHLAALIPSFLQATEFSSITFNGHLPHPQYFSQAQPADMHAMSPACKAFLSGEAILLVVNGTDSALRFSITYWPCNLGRHFRFRSFSFLIGK